MVEASLVAQMLKNLPATREIWFRSLGWEDPLEKEWLPSPVLLPGKSHRQRSLAGYSSWGHKESDTSEQLSTHAHMHALRKREKPILSHRCPISDAGLGYKQKQV